MIAASRNFFGGEGKGRKEGRKGGPIREGEAIGRLLRSAGKTHLGKFPLPLLKREEKWGFCFFL